MADVFEPAMRSRIMSRIRSKDTKPEMVVRRLVTALGYRYRLHVGTLPGKPDLVFRRSRKVIFIHGCYWHRHNCKRGRSLPASNTAFWQGKWAANKRRDREVLRGLRSMGYRILVVWECELHNEVKTLRTVRDFLREEP